MCPRVLDITWLLLHHLDRSGGLPLQSLSSLTIFILFPALPVFNWPAWVVSYCCHIITHLYILSLSIRCVYMLPYIALHVLLTFLYIHTLPTLNNQLKITYLQLVTPYCTLANNIPQTFQSLPSSLYQLLVLVLFQYTLMIRFGGGGGWFGWLGSHTPPTCIVWVVYSNCQSDTQAAVLSH